MLTYDSLDISFSKRQIDKTNGYLRVKSCNITKEQVAPYYGSEIPNWREFGLDSKTIYYVYRPEAELAKAADTFNNLPLTRDHIEVAVDDVPKERIVGSLGDRAEYKAPYLTNSLMVYDKTDIDNILNGNKKELSCGYRYTPVKKSGEWHGQHYDFVMTDIVGNHVALVKEGRAGHDVVVADSKPDFEEKEKEMVEDGVRINGEFEDEEDIEWITVHGTHIPIKKGEDKRQAISNFFKRNEEAKEGIKNAFERINKTLKEGASEKSDWISEKVDSDTRPENTRNKKLASFLKEEADIQKGDTFEIDGKKCKLVDIDMNGEEAILKDEKGNEVREDLEALVKREYQESYSGYKGKEESSESGYTQKSYFDNKEEWLKKYNELSKMGELKEQDIDLKKKKSATFKTGSGLVTIEYEDKDLFAKEESSKENEAKKEERKDSESRQERNTTFGGFYGDIKNVGRNRWIFEARHEKLKDPLFTAHIDGFTKKEAQEQGFKSFQDYIKKDVDGFKKDVKEMLDKAQTTNDKAIPDEQDKPETAGEEKAETKESKMTEDKEALAEEKKAKDEKDIEGKEKKAFAEGVDYGEEKEKSEPKKLDSEHESEGAKKADEKKKEEKEAEDKCTKDSALTMDIDTIKAQVREEVIADFKAREEARKSVESIVGEINVMAFDSCSDIYKLACEKEGLPVNEIVSYKDALTGYLAGKSKLTMDASPVSGSNEECFKDIRV